MCVKEGATISAANFERVQGILSNPVAFLLSTVFNNQRTFLDTCISKRKGCIGKCKFTKWNFRCQIWTYVYPVKCTLKNIQQFRADKPEYREEKSLRHVAMVAKFLDDNKPKRHLKGGFTLFQTSSILFNFFAVRVAVAKTPYCCHPEILLPW